MQQSSLRTSPAQERQVSEELFFLLGSQVVDCEGREPLAFPLAIFGGEFWYGMAIVIMCGLGVGTLLTFSFVPVLYSLFFDGLSYNKKRQAVPQKVQPEPSDDIPKEQEK